MGESKRKTWQTCHVAMAVLIPCRLREWPWQARKNRFPRTVASYVAKWDVIPCIRYDIKKPLRGRKCKQEGRILFWFLLCSTYFLSAHYRFNISSKSVTFTSPQ